MRTIKRRDLLCMGGVVGVGLGGAPGCSFFSRAPANGERTREHPDHSRGNEAPNLSARVNSGELPPAGRRLPRKPCVVKPLHDAGDYGGTLRRAQPDPSTTLVQTIAPSSLLQWRLTATEPEADLVESWQVRGNREFTFRLREGLKWSDGEPFTVDDLVFTLAHVFGNERLSPVYPTWLVSGGKSPHVERVDDWTLRLSWSQPNALLVRNLCHPARGLSLILPQHYLKEFHAGLADAAKLQREVRRHHFESWEEYFVDRCDTVTNPERPVMGAFKVGKPLSPTSLSGYFDRNPYYYKVDDGGRQLPYVDRVAVDLLDYDSIQLRAANGDYQMQGNYISYAEAPVLLRNAKQHHYSVYRWIPEQTLTCIYFNHSHADPVVRGLFHNIDFRAGLSHAIDRDELNKVMTGGLGVVKQAFCAEGDDYYIPGGGQRFLEHDQQKANALLDSAGLDRRGDDGFRLRPDGRPLKLVLSTWQEDSGLNRIDEYQFVRRYWRRIGIDLQVRTISNELWVKEVETGKHDLSGNMITESMWDLEPVWYVPLGFHSYMATQYGLWYSSEGKEGMKPPPAFKELQDAWDELIAAASDEARIAAGKKIMRSHDENVWILGLVKPPFQPVVVADDLANVLKKGLLSYYVGREGQSKFEQMYFKDTRRHPDG